MFRRDKDAQSISDPNDCPSVAAGYPPSGNYSVPRTGVDSPRRASESNTDRMDNCPNASDALILPPQRGISL